MSIRTLLDAERRRYLAAYVATKAEQTARRDNVVGELLISINDASLPYPYRYFRADIVSKAPDGSPLISEVLLDPDPASEPTGFDFGAFQVELYPFSWCRLQILFDKQERDLSQLEGWMTRWLDIEDDNAGQQGDFSDAIHSVSRVETNGTWWFFTVDLGTAPVECLIEIIELLAAQGMSRIVLKAG